METHLDHLENLQSVNQAIQLASESRTCDSALAPALKLQDVASPIWRCRRRVAIRVGDEGATAGTKVQAT
eukprot:6632664-Pyramimonas_sp.AAC.1